MSTHAAKTYTGASDWVVGVFVRRLRLLHEVEKPVCTHDSLCDGRAGGAGLGDARCLIKDAQRPSAVKGHPKLLLKTTKTRWTFSSAICGCVNRQQQTIGLAPSLLCPRWCRR